MELTQIIKRYLAALFFLFISCSLIAAQTNNEIFQKFVGEEVELDKLIIKQLLEKEGEKKLLFDSDNDGKIDVIYMIDNDERHEEWYKPILVKIIDEDGDMYLTNEGDYDSDLYVADWHADGDIDRIVDYKDLDNDNDLDEQYLFYYMDSSYASQTHQKWLLKYGKKPETYQTKYPEKDYLLHWTKDISDDNRVQWFINYEVKQNENQWLSDNSGDEMFINSFVFDYENNRLIPSEEHGFCFFDEDDDGYPEVAARFGGMEKTIENFRYSMDLDNDARGRKKQDYDFSITCIGEVELAEEISQTLSVREHITEAIARWDKIRQFGKISQWEKTHLTWDEHDRNIAGWAGLRKGNYGKERWEGIINHPTRYMKIVGGPSCGQFNKRSEVDTSYIGKLKFYYSNIDHRFHLYGADVGWIMVDYDYDYKMDMFIWMEDSDHDGFIDTWKYDLNGDCFGEQLIIANENYRNLWSYEDIVSEDRFERIYSTKNDKEELLDISYKSLHPIYTEGLQEIVDENQEFINLAKNTLADMDSDFKIDPIEKYFSTELKNYGDDVFVDQWGGVTMDMHWGENIRKGLEGTRYYQDLIRERYWAKLITSKEISAEMAKAYEEGRLSDVNRLLEEQFNVKTSVELSGFKKQFTLTITNPSDLFLENNPFIIPASEIKAKYPNVDLTNIVLMESNRKIDYRIIPTQVDDLNQDGEFDELVFLYSIPPNSSIRLNAYSILDDNITPEYKTKTAVHQDWWKVEENTIGWESNWAAYRMFNGRIDFLGKKLEGHYLKEEDYHNMHVWGMDVLNLGKSSGLGGISLWEGDSQFRSFNYPGEKNVKVDKRIVASGPVRSMIEVKFSDIKTENDSYEVLLNMSIFAENDYSIQSIIINSEKGNEIVYSPGIRKIENDKWTINTNSGTLATWALETGIIGEVGLGLIFPVSDYLSFSENEHDRYVKLKIPSGEKQTHYIYGRWRKGYISPTAPNLDNLEKDIKLLSRKLRVPVTIDIQ